MRVIYPQSNTAMEHQRAFLNRMIADGFPPIFLHGDAGVGKAFEGIILAQELFNRDKIDAVFYLAPNGVDDNFKSRELTKHSTGDYFAARWMSTPKKKDLEQIQLAIHKRRDHLTYLCCPTHALSHSKIAADIATFVKTHNGRVLGIIDEHHGLTNGSSRAVKNLIGMRRMFQYKCLMSGTPVRNKPTDLFWPCNFLDEAILGKSEYALKASVNIYLPSHHPLVRAVSANTRFPPQIQAKDSRGNLMYNKEGLARMMARLTPHIVRQRREDVLDLPEQIFVDRTIDPSADQVGLIKPLARQVMDEIGAGNPSQAMVTLLRMQQLTGGWDPTTEKMLTKNPKLELLQQVIDEIPDDEPVIIWARFRHEIDAIAQLLRMAYTADQVVEYHGGVSAEDRQRAINDFQAGKIRFFVGNQQTAGVGITLTKSTYAIYYSHTYSYTDFEQSKARNYRIGTTSKVTYFNLILRSPNFVFDDHIINALRSKQDVSSYILRDKINLLGLA